MNTIKYIKTHYVTFIYIYIYYMEINYYKIINEYIFIYKNTIFYNYMEINDNIIKHLYYIVVHKSYFL